jgi:glycosyltransferase involved in cell wall biosynthesis
LPLTLTYVRLWDVATTPRVDQFIANSREVAARIARYYGRTATVIPPPVDLSPYRPWVPGNFYLAGGRLIPYKRLDLVVQAFTALGLPLKIFGIGRDRERLQALAGSNVEFLGQISEDQRHDLFASCRAFVFPGEEDFGITPLEAMSAGRPVIAYASGGALETVVEGMTGRFFHEQTAAALAVAVAASRGDRYDPANIRRHAEGFSREVFLTRMREVIADKETRRQGDKETRR